MEIDRNSEGFKVRIENLAIELVNNDKIECERERESELLSEIIDSRLPVCVEFYEKYLDCDKPEYYRACRVRVLFHYFCLIARCSDPEFSSEIFEVISGANDYSFDKLIAANPNPSISVKLLRQIGNKKYDPIKPEIGAGGAISLPDYISNQTETFLSVFKKDNDLGFELSLGENVQYRFEILQRSINGGVRPSLQWIVRENILNRQQLILQEFAKIFGGEIDPIYKNLDIYMNHWQSVLN
jgi:hypothetical protein